MYYHELMPRERGRPLSSFMPLLFRCSWLGTADFDPLFSPRASDEGDGSGSCFSTVFCRNRRLGAAPREKKGESSGMLRQREVGSEGAFYLLIAFYLLTF